MKKAILKKLFCRKGIFISLGVIFDVVLGVGAGFGLHEILNGGVTTNYDAINASDYAVDTAALIKKYQSLLSSGGDFESNFSGADMANVAITLFKNNKHTFAQGVGSATASFVTQEIRSTIIRSDSSYFEESLSSSSFVSLALRMYETDEVTKQYKGKIGSNVETGVYDETPSTNYSEDEYKEWMGQNLDDSPIIYLISDKTIIQDTADGTSGIKNGVQKSASGYTIDLELDPVVSVANYVIQMKNISDLADKPSFNYVHLTFVTDLQLNLVSMLTHESYYAKTSSGLGSSIKSSIQTKFETSGDYEIPDLNVPISYWDD